MSFGKKKKISLFAKISFCLFAMALAIFLVTEISVNAADLVNRTVSAYLRMALAALGDLFPFSLFELLVALLPILIILLVILAKRSFVRGRGVRFVADLLALVLIILSEYLLTLGVGYNTTTIDRDMGIERIPVTRENLAEVMVLLRDEVNSLAPLIEYGEGGDSTLDLSFEDISAALCEAHASISEKYGLVPGFSSRAKEIRFGNVMSYFGLLGIYTFFTGESNVNSYYPMYDKVFTAAHELSHQRGVMREDEANFMAYMILSDSEDAYFKYSAALNMYQYIGSALYRTDKELYYSINSGLDERARGDILASNAVYKKYGDTILNDISDFLNDLFLKSNGTAGVVSYGYVVSLTVSYFESQK